MSTAVGDSMIPLIPPRVNIVVISIFFFFSRQLDHPSPRRRQPGEDLDACRHGDRIVVIIIGTPSEKPRAADERVVDPLGEPEHQDGEQRQRHQAVSRRSASSALVEMTSRDDPEARQHHDVDGRVGGGGRRMLLVIDQRPHKAMRRRSWRPGRGRSAPGPANPATNGVGDHDQQRRREKLAHTSSGMRQTSCRARAW